MTDKRMVVVGTLDECCEVIEAWAESDKEYLLYGFKEDNFYEDYRNGFVKKKAIEDFITHEIKEIVCFKNNSECYESFVRNKYNLPEWENQSIGYWFLLGTKMY